MPTVLTAQAVEKSTFVITASFYDEDNNLVAPTTLTWTLTDQFGLVMNSRVAVTLTPAATVTVVLHGDDLALPDRSRTGRVLTFQGVYQSSLGTLELKDAVEFTIIDLVAVS